MSLAEHQVRAPSFQRSVGAGRLSTKSRDDKSCVDRLYQQGCAKIRLPKAYHATALEAVMINTSGGVTGGDRLSWEFSAAPQTHLMITTQACEKVYKASQDVAQQKVTLRAGPGARLAWLPQETILYNRSAFARTISLELAADAEALVLEPLLIGRTTHGEVVETAHFTDQWRVRRDGQMIHAEAFSLQGDIPNLLKAPVVTAGQTAMATLLFISPLAEGYLSPARDLIGQNGGVSYWNGKLLARVLAKDGLTLRKRLLPLVRLLNFGADLPKVWSL